MNEFRTRTYVRLYWDTWVRYGKPDTSEGVVPEDLKRYNNMWEAIGDGR